MLKEFDETVYADVVSILNPDILLISEISELRIRIHLPGFGVRSSLYVTVLNGESRVSLTPVVQPEEFFLHSLDHCVCMIVTVHCYYDL